MTRNIKMRRNLLLMFLICCYILGRCSGTTKDDGVCDIITHENSTLLRSRDYLRECKFDRFQCNDGICIDKIFVCDVEEDCDDGEDEEQDCVSYTECKEEYFSCNTTHRCIAPHAVCDGDDDCGDNSDEVECDGKEDDKFSGTVTQPFNSSQHCAIYQDSFNNNSRDVVESTKELKDIGDKITQQLCLKDKYTEVLKFKYSLLNFTSKLNTRDETLNVCLEFINDSNVHMKSFVSLFSLGLYQWYPVIDWDRKNINYSVTQDLFTKCNKSTDIIIQEMLKYPSSVDDFKFSLIPSIRWACPFYHIPIENYLSERQNLLMEQLFMFVLDFEIFSLACMKLLCNASIFPVETRPITVVIDVNGSDQFHKCQQAATRKTTFDKNIFIFSFDSFLKIVFVVGENKMDNPKARFFTLVHYANDPHIRNCCNHIHDDWFYPNYYFNIDAETASTTRSYFFCYGTSDLCKSTNTSITTEKGFGDNYVVVLRENIVQSKVIQWMVMLNVQISSPVFEYILNMEYEYDMNLGFNVLTFKVNINDTENMKMIVSKLQNESYFCDTTEYFTICLKDTTFVMFIFNCSLNYPVNDKVFLLLLNYYFNIGLNEEYLCQKNMAVIRNLVELRNIATYGKTYIISYLKIIYGDQSGICVDYGIKDVVNINNTKCN